MPLGQVTGCVRSLWRGLDLATQDTPAAVESERMGGGRVGERKQRGNRGRRERERRIGRRERRRGKGEGQRRTKRDKEKSTRTCFIFSSNMLIRLQEYTMNSWTYPLMECSNGIYTIEVIHSLPLSRECYE